MEHYLDNAATTAVLPCARAAALAAMEQFGNPGSLHAKGAAARKTLDDSRKALAAALGCKTVGCVLADVPLGILRIVDFLACGAGFSFIQRLIQPQRRADMGTAARAIIVILGKLRIKKCHRVGVFPLQVWCRPMANEPSRAPSAKLTQALPERNIFWMKVAIAFTFSRLK